MHIVIDGNIGSGKTTQLNLLAKSGWSVKREPIDEWPLELFYKDMSRWALLLQMRILQTVRQTDDPVTVYERGMLATRHVFWEYLREKKHVTVEEHTVYESAYEKYVWYPNVYIYLSKDPKIAIEHVRQRHQKGDSSVTLAYLQDLDRLYKRFLANVPCKVHVVNANRTPEEIHVEVVSILSLYTVRGPNGIMLSRDEERAEVSEGTLVSCTPTPIMCRVS